jgi:hypothetical protein
MSMLVLKCPKCSAEAKLYLDDTSYSGPRRCWKCHEFFTITIYNNQVTSCEPLSAEEYEMQQAAQKAAEKSGGHVNFAKPAQPATPAKAAEKPESGINFSKQTQMEFPQNTQSEVKPAEADDTDIFKILAGKSKGGIDISSQSQPEKPREFIKASVPVDPQSQPAPKKAVPTYPPEKPRDLSKPLGSKEPQGQKKPDTTTPKYDSIRTFVPIEDIKEEPVKPKKEIPPEERWNNFIPPQT